MDIQIGGAKLAPFMNFPDPTQGAVIAFLGPSVRSVWKPRGDMESKVVAYSEQEAQLKGLDVYKDRADCFPVIVLSADIKQGKDKDGKQKAAPTIGEIRTIAVRGTLYVALRKVKVKSSIPKVIARKGKGKKTTWEIDDTEWPDGWNERKAAEQWALSEYNPRGITRPVQAPSDDDDDDAYE